MKKIFLLSMLVFLMSSIYHPIAAQQNADQKKTALLIIDIQEFYFPEGSVPLVNPLEAAINARELLNAFRNRDLLIVHIRHNASSDGDIHPIVMPLENEEVITKNKANAFIGTDLLDYLNDNKITDIIICGMQTHMCVEAATRAASDYGFNCTVIEDACATRDLKYRDNTIKAIEVHYSTLSALNKTYATIKTTHQFLNELK
ncbi:MAG TPA: cysteine hydrolase family protein [Bacteroidales bacterium]|nr:cysteine hydrolase family protein [Bacteroidales bacterium]